MKEHYKNLNLIQNTLAHIGTGSQLPTPNSQVLGSIPGMIKFESDESSQLPNSQYMID